MQLYPRHADRQFGSMLWSAGCIYPAAEAAGRA